MALYNIPIYFKIFPEKSCIREMTHLQVFKGSNVLLRTFTQMLTYGFHFLHVAYPLCSTLDFRSQNEKFTRVARVVVLHKVRC